MDQPACLVCGGPTPVGRTKPFKYCSEQCRADVHRRRQRIKWRLSSSCAIGVRPCIDCGGLFTYRQSGNVRLRCHDCWPTWKKGIQRESRQRLAAARKPCPLGRATKVRSWADPARIPRPKRRGAPRRECAGCGVILANKFGKWCSEHCYNTFGRSRPTSTPIEVGTCTECGAKFVRRANQLGAYCGRHCQRLAHKRTRRHRLRANGLAEHFTLREIAERDNWRCHLCHRKINPLLDPQHDRAASLDHLIPVSDDGEHVRENVAVAHRDCNWQRSTGGDVQLRLVG